MILRRNRQLAGWVGAALCTLALPALAAPPLPSPTFFLTQTDRSLSRARTAVDEGQRLLARYEFDQAAQSFQRGVELMLDSSAPADDELLGTALVELAVAYTRAGQRELARETLMELGRLVPNHVVDSSLYPGVFLREVEEARLALENGPRGTLVLRGPRGARVEVDGRALGALPTEASLPVGRHRVRIGDRQRLVKLGARGGMLDLSREAGADSVPRASAAAEAPDRPSTPARQEEDVSGVAWAEEPAPRETVPSGSGEDTRGTRTLPGIEAMTADRAQDGDEERLTTDGPPWWVWALVGVGVAAAAGGTVIGVQNAMGAAPIGGTTGAATP